MVKDGDGVAEKETVLDGEENTLLLLADTLLAEALSKLEATEEVGLARRTSEDVGTLETARELWLASADETIELLALALARPPLTVADDAEARIEALSLDALWGAATLEEAWALTLELATAILDEVATTELALAVSLAATLAEIAEDTAMEDTSLGAAEEAETAVA